MLRNCPGKASRQVQEVSADEPPEHPVYGHAGVVQIDNQWKGNIPRTTSNSSSSNNDVKRIELDVKHVEPDVKHIGLDVNNFEPDVKHIELDVDKSEPDDRWKEVKWHRCWKGMCKAPPGLGKTIKENSFQALAEDEEESIAHETCEVMTVSGVIKDEGGRKGFVTTKCWGDLGTGDIAVDAAD